MLVGRANLFCSPVEVGEVFVAVSPDNHWVYQSAGPMGNMEKYRLHVPPILFGYSG